MDDIVFQPFFSGELHNSLRKFRDVLCNVTLAFRLLGPCGNMNHAVSETEVMQNMRHVLILRARENIHMDAQTARGAEKQE